MGEAKKIYDCSMIADSINYKELDFEIDVFNEQEQVLQQFFDSILKMSEGFDFHRSKEVLMYLQTVDVTDRSLLNFSATLSSFCINPVLKKELDVFSIYLLKLFDTGNHLTTKANLLEDEKEILENQFDLYRGLIFDFSRELEKIFIE